tara:strand:+ start:101 stop:217 length:117 start_codon:yes stop_codon:yes gene_type:complete
MGRGGKKKKNQNQQQEEQKTESDPRVVIDQTQETNVSS